jgi:hypothetical protein
MASPLNFTIRNKILFLPHIGELAAVAGWIRKSDVIPRLGTR